MHSFEASSDAEKLQLAILSLRHEGLGESPPTLGEATPQPGTGEFSPRHMELSQALTSAGRVLSSIVMPEFVESVLHLSGKHRGTSSPGAHVLPSPFLPLPFCACVP